jgi:hypothetical protein
VWLDVEGRSDRSLRWITRLPCAACTRFLVARKQRALAGANITDLSMTLPRRFAALVVLWFASTLVVADDAKNGAAAASTAKPAEPTEQSAGKERQTEVSCTNERVTGSRFTRRVCHSREEREMMQRAGREAVERIQQMPTPVMSD